MGGGVDQCVISRFLWEIHIKNNEKGIKLAENNAYFVMTIIITRENGGVSSKSVRMV